MRVVFMAKSKRSAVRALDWLVERGSSCRRWSRSEPDAGRSRAARSTSPRASTGCAGRASEELTRTRPRRSTLWSRSSSGT